jgi:hypothetical protein
MGAHLAQVLTAPLMGNYIAAPTVLAGGLATMSNPFMNKSGITGTVKAATAPSLRTQIGSYRSSRRKTLNSRETYRHSNLADRTEMMIPPPQRNPMITQVTHSVAKIP